jgi:hypothetical protein
MIHREIVIDPAVIHDVPLHQYGPEIQRNCHGGPDSLGKVSFSKNNFFVIADIYTVT